MQVDEVLVVVVLLVAVVLFFLLVRKREKARAQMKSPPEAKDQALYLAPSSASDERVKRVLPTKGTEDVSHLLAIDVPEELRLPKPMQEDSDRLPDEKVDWAVHVEFNDQAPLDRTSILEVLNREWLGQNGFPEIYGFSPETGHWTYMRARGAPPTCTELCLGWKLYEDQGDSSLPITASLLSDYQQAVESAAARLGDPVVKPLTSPEEGEKRSIALAELVEECGRYVTIVLRAAPGAPFKGKDIWDTMLSLGLRWGDMDLFHWENRIVAAGGDHFFSVWTSTPPGYFLPERIAAGTVAVDDLVFGYSIPRSADPEGVFKSLLKAVKYAQDRLGGTVCDFEGIALDEDQEIEKIRSVVDRLEVAGFRPGSYEGTLYLF